MIKYILFGLTFMCLFNITAYANPITKQTTKHKEEFSLGLGAILGGLIGGPPGAIIGAAGGAWIGDKEEKEDDQFVTLEKRLLEKQAELAYLQNEFGKLETEHSNALQSVSLNTRHTSVSALSRGITLTVYFRTGDAAVNESTRDDIEKLAEFLYDFPEIKLQLEAHTDQRGGAHYNLRLSKERAKSVTNELLRAGIEPDRIKQYAHGESEAHAPAGDIDGYAFDRRVNIYLTLDTEV